MRLQPYSAHLDETSQSFTLIVKVYSGGPPEFAGVSGYLGSVEVGDFVHVPEIRQLDWRRDSKRTGMVCLGVRSTIHTMHAFLASFLFCSFFSFFLSPLLPSPPDYS